MTAMRRHNSLLNLALAPILLAVAPQASVHAQPLAEPPTPPLRGGRLEWRWARLRRTQKRLEQRFDNAPQRIDRVQALVDRARENGKDVLAVESALNHFAEAVKDARPVLKGTQGIVAAHQGFDADGRVTDLEKAEATVSELAQELAEVRRILSGPARALRDALAVFREANPTR